MSHSSSSRRPPAWALGLPLLFTAPAWAQSEVPSTIVITGNPLARPALLQPASVLAGDGLVLRRAATLGETTDGLPGVAATGFGPNSSRPVIRGLDGDRVRMLDNGGAAIDASGLSFDHAVALDPLVLERIEVLRGPAALLYGGSAAGGVVNSIHNRIPRAAMAGLEGRAEARVGGAADERSAAAVLEGGSGGLAWHLDAFGRKTADLRVPRHVPLEDGVPLERTDRVRNSASRAEGGAVGAGWVGAQGRLGASAETYRNRYGVTVEPEVTIRMRRERQAVGGEWRTGTGPIAKWSADASSTRYQHQEVEGSGEVGTTFRYRGEDARLELQQARIGALQGVWGLQWERLDASALGEEAFVPATHTRQGALFVLQELELAGLALSAGWRGERVRVQSDGDAADASEPRFGAAQGRRFSPGSFSLGLRGALPAGFEASLMAAASERAPTYYELFANGVHIATGVFERGDSTLATERSRHLELGLAWRSGATAVKASLFRTRYRNYIALDATGTDITLPAENPGDPDQVVPEYAFRAVRARLAGFELEGQTGWTWAGWSLGLAGHVDQVRGDNLDRGEPLPRLAPTRARLSAELGQGPWRLGIGVRHAERQNRVSATDTATAGYSLLDLWAGWRLPVPGEATAWLRLTNATDRLAYNAVAVSTVRGLTPLPGRGLAAGLRWRW